MNWFKKIAKTEYTSCIMADISAKTSQEIKLYQKEIISEDILVGQGFEEHIHITIKYGLATDDVNLIKAFLKNEPPIKVKLGDIGFFKKNPDFDVVIVKVESQDLENLNKRISETFSHRDTYKGYTPHLTLAYVEKGKAARFAGDKHFSGKEITIDQISFSSSIDDEPIRIKLRNK